MRKLRLRKRMYAVSKEGVSIISGTMAYSRKAAISHFLPQQTRWEIYKQNGYRIVLARVEIIQR